MLNHTGSFGLCFFCSLLWSDSNIYAFGYINCIKFLLRFIHRFCRARALFRSSTRRLVWLSFVCEDICAGAIRYALNSRQNALSAHCFFSSSSKQVANGGSILDDMRKSTIQKPNRILSIQYCAKIVDNGHKRNIK